MGDIGLFYGRYRALCGEPEHRAEVLAVMSEDTRTATWIQMQLQVLVANARRIPLRVRFGRRGGVDVAVDSTSPDAEHGVDQSRCLVDAQRAEDALVTSTLARFGRSSP